jgi:uncharacterized protein
VSTTVEVFNRCMEKLVAKDIEGFLELLHPDCVLEFPFAVPGRPRRLSGSAEVREFFLADAKLIEVRGVNELTTHQTTDPETIVVEFNGDGIALATGEPCEISFVSVFTARDGLCVRYRDYWNPATTLAMQGKSPD